LKKGEKFEFDDSEFDDYTILLKEPRPQLLLLMERLWWTLDCYVWLSIIVETDDLRFIVNFKYVLKEKFYNDLEYVSTSNYEAFDTICSETMVGFV